MQQQQQQQRMHSSLLHSNKRSIRRTGRQDFSTFPEHKVVNMVRQRGYGPVDMREA